MRPCGEVRQALYQACKALATPERGATLREMAQHAQVGMDAARRTVSNMARTQQLRKARERPVDYRNRPVLEYFPGAPEGDAPAGTDLAVFRVWG